MKYGKPFQFKARIVKCPKCYQLLEYEGTSEISANSAVHDLYEKVTSHLTERCFSRNSKGRNKVPIVIVTKYEKENSTFSEFDSNNLLIV